jgi:Mrp family chromosome partitioning ATPase/capsular polysaccharide biosynthesis protein
LNQPATAHTDIHVLEQLLAIARRRWVSVVLLALVGLGLGYLYALSQVPTYATYAAVMVRTGPAVDPLRQGVETTSPEEEGQFLSHLELARSTSVATMVTDRLGLGDDPAFAAQGKSRLEQWIYRLTGRGDAKPAPLGREAAIARLLNNIKVLRVGRTYVMSMSYSHPDPAVSQKIAQAYAEALKQKLAEQNDIANSRLRTAIQGEIDRATGPAKEALQLRLQEAIVSRALPGIDGLVLTDARLPSAPVSPRAGFLAAVGLVIGAVLGCALAGLRELADRGIRDGDALARRTSIRFLGYLPRRAARAGSDVTLGKGALPDAARRVVVEPHSVFGETVRAVGAAILAGSQGERGCITGLTAALPGEGTFLLAANVAAHLASLGRSVLLVDAESREARLSKWLGAGAEQGLVEALLQDKPLEESVLYDSRTNLSLLPLVTGGDRLVEPSALFASARAPAFFEALRSQYQHIIVDFAALSRAADARAAASLVDGYVLTVPWGVATPQFVDDLLAAEPEVRGKLLGTVLTRANLAQLPLYAAAGSRASFQRRIARR